MSKRDDRLLVDDILIALQAISEYTCNMDYDGFCESKMTIDAVIRNFEICGEASNYLSAEYKAEHPEIEWQKMTDFRTRASSASNSIIGHTTRPSAADTSSARPNWSHSAGSMPSLVL